MSIGIKLAEHGWLTDRMVRAAIRHRCRKSLKRHLRETDHSQRQFLEQSRESPIALVPEKANEQHYELPAEFFAAVLGRHRKYSCCYWPDRTRSLDDAEEAMLRISAQRANLTDGMRILELGCGWGSFTLWVAANFPEVQITAVSNSHAQRKCIESRAAELGVSHRVEVITADANEFSTREKFDRIVSIEMFEHLRNHREFVRRMASWLRADGALFVHVFCHREFAYPFEIDGDQDWMANYFFTGGMMPSFDWLKLQIDSMTLQSAEWIDGTQYQKTCDAWLENMTRNQTRVMEILKRTYGAESCAWYHRWRIFFMACSELFGLDRGSQWGIGHYVFQR